MYRGLFVLLLAAFSSRHVLGQTSRYIGEVIVTNPGLITTFAHTGGNVFQRTSILVSTYSTSVNSYDPSVALHYPGEALATNFSGYAGKNIFNFLYWPKEVAQVPRDVFSHDAIVHVDGSTILGKGRGSVYVSDVSDIRFPATYDIGVGLVPATQNYMYTSGLWKRIDNNARTDFITCRYQLESGALKAAELVWLNQPLNGLTASWGLPTVLLENACDSFLAEVELRLGLFDNYEVIYATGQHTKNLTFFYTSGGLNNWHDPTKIGVGVVQTGREFYDVKTVDVNNDGKIDILVTVVGNTGGSVEVFEIPNDFRITNQYTRRVLAEGFTARNGGAAGRSPGIARPFYPTNNQNRKPWIYVAGADDGRAYYLRPTSEQATNWAYELVTIADHGANHAVTGMTSADIDGDGNTELFDAVRQKNRVEVHTFRPLK